MAKSYACRQGRVPPLDSGPGLAGRVWGWFPLLAWILWSGCAQESGSGSTDAAREVWRACLLCHGTREMQRGPILDGIPAWYLESQLRKFQSGIRGRNADNRSEALMGAAIGQLLAPGQQAEVAAYVAALPHPRHRLTVDGNRARGRELFQICKQCHGEQALGNPTLKSAPLQLYEDWYLLGQLRNFKSGLRGHHPEDVQGRTMQQIVQPLADTDLRDVVSYITGELARRNQPGTN